MKRLFVTFVSCIVLLSATVTTPALAEAKDEAQQSDVSVFQAALTTASDGIQSVLDGVKTNIAELFGTNEQIALDNSESTQQPASFSAQDTESAAAIPSNLTGVVWSADYKTCTLQSGHNFDGSSLASEIDLHRDTLTTFEAENNTSLTGVARNLFIGCQNLRTVNLAESFNTSQVTDMRYMFYDCSSLTSLALPDAFDTHLVTNMSYMFRNCSSLTSLAFPDSFDTGQVTDMRYMFCNCSSLTSLAFPDSFDTGQVTNMISMFENCSSLTSLTLPSVFNTDKVLNMDNMFLDCNQLERLDLSMFSSASLTTCPVMFANCYNLKELNLGNFVPPAGQASIGMFADCDLNTGEIFGPISNIEKITMSGACILEPGEGATTDMPSGTFFDYKEPLSWSAYYQGNAVEGEPSAQGDQKNCSADLTAVLTGFDEFEAYQGTRPGLTTFILNKPTPPGPTPPGPTPGPTPEPTPGPTPDVAPAADADVLPLTSDTSAIVSFALPAVLLIGLALLVSGYSLSRKRLQ